MIIKSKNKNLYWNIISEKEMKNVLKVAKKNWKKAVCEMNIGNYTKDYIINEKKRGKIINLILKKIKENNIKNPKVLDIGAGFGAISIGLARKFDTTSIDVNPYTLKFIKYRAEQEKVKINLKKIKNLVYGLPIKAFDIIVMNGVLEWVGCDLKGDVESIQKKALKNVFKVLKKKGLLFLAIENRLAFDWFKGKTSHVPIKFIDLIPRKLADWVSLKKRGEKFRVYIYSKWKYKTILKNIGFKKIKFYTAYPNYQKPIKISRNINPFVNSFIIIAEK